MAADWDVPFDDADARDAAAAAADAADLDASERAACAVVNVWNVVVTLGALLGFLLFACLAVASAVLVLAGGVSWFLPLVAVAGAFGCAGLNRASQAAQQRWFRRLVRRHAVVAGAVGGSAPVALPALRDDP